MLGLAVAAAVLGVLVATPNGNSSTPGLVAAYAFDEGSGTTVADASGNGNNGHGREHDLVELGQVRERAQLQRHELARHDPRRRLPAPDTAMTLEAWVSPRRSPTSGAT